MVEWKRTIEFEPATIDLAEFARSHGMSVPPRSGTLAPGQDEPVVIIDRAAWEAIEAHARSATVEVGGLLVGEALRDGASGRPVTLVRGAIPAIGGASSSVSFTFTPDAWDYLTRERDRAWPELITVGWFHTHPNLGVFYSSTDRSTQQAFFNQPWNVGLVIDPLAPTNQVGVFAGAQSHHLPADALRIVPLDETPVATTPEAATAIRQWQQDILETQLGRISLTLAGMAAGIAVAWAVDRARDGWRSRG